MRASSRTCSTGSSSSRPRGPGRRARGPHPAALARSRRSPISMTLCVRCSRSQRSSRPSALAGGAARAGGDEDGRLRPAARDSRARGPGRARAAHAPRRLGQRAPRRARRPDLRGRAAAAAAAALRARARQEGADRVRRLLRAVRPAARRARRRHGRAARRRRQPGDRRPRRRPAADGARRREGPRALRLVSRAARAGAPRRRLPADPVARPTSTPRAYRYRQESFAAQTSETGSLVSFIRLDVDATGARRRSSSCG